MSNMKKPINQNVKPKTVKSPVIKRNMSVFNLCAAVVVAIINIMFCFIFVNLNSFSNFSKGIFVSINIVMLIILLALNFVFIITMRTRRTGFFNTLVAMLIILSFIGSYGTYAMVKVNKNINKIVDKGAVSEKVETSIVVFSESGTYAIESEEQLDGKTIGAVSQSTNTELAKKQLESKKINVSYQEFQDNNELLIALFNNQIDAAVLPSNYVGIFEVNDGYDTLLSKTKAISTFESVVQVTTEATSNKDITKEPFSVLVIGVDEGRSDALILATFNPISMKLTMTSIARDSYVPIACYAGKGSDKLGHARVRSRQCTIDTVEGITGTDIDYYFESNFKGIVAMVDALGGIVVNNPYEFVGQTSSSTRGIKTVWVPAGTDAPLNGEQALAFARERHLYASGDFQRQANQQQVIKAIFTKAMRTADLNKLLATLDAAGDNVSTNLTPNQLIDLFNFVMKKSKRYYDKSHPENVVLIQGSRITGYNSGIWNEGAQLTLSIIRLFEGSIKDNKAAILRNTDMKDSKLEGPKSWRWDANWVFVAPTISNETYAEQRVVDEVPDTVINFIGKSVADANAWANPRGVSIHIATKDCAADRPACGGYGDGFIIDQSVRAGIKTSNTSEITITVTSNTGGTSAPKAGAFPVIIRYVLQEGGTAFPDNSFTTGPDGAYNVNSPVKDGYTANPGNINGTATGPVDVTVTYIKNATQAPTQSPEQACAAAGKHWYDNKCNDNPKPAATPTAEQACTANGKYWYEGKCNDSPQQTAQQACEGSGKHWYDNKCNEAPQQTAEQKCIADGKNWYDNGCHDSPKPTDSSQPTPGDSGTPTTP